MTPNDIEILIHCYVSPTAHPRFEANVDVIGQLVNAKLIERCGEEPNVYTTTERGNAHIHQLCTTSWPVQVWTDGHGKIIDLES